MTNTPNNIASEEWEKEWRRIRCIANGFGIAEENAPMGTYQYLQCGLCGRKWHYGETPPICQQYREKYPNEVAFIHKTRQEAIAGERLRIAKELERRVLKIEEMVTDERGLHLIVNPDELEDGMAQLFTGNIFVYLLNR